MKIENRNSNSFFISLSFIGVYQLCRPAIAAGKQIVQGTDERKQYNTKFKLMLQKIEEK